MAMTMLSLAAMLQFPHALADELAKDGEAVGVIERAEPLSLEDLICSFSWPCHQALHVAQCESTMNPRAYAAGNHGLMQINGIHAHQVGGNVEALYDAETNLRVAHSLWLRQGWGPWAHCGRSFR